MILIQHYRVECTESDTNADVFEFGSVGCRVIVLRSTRDALYSQALKEIPEDIFMCNVESYLLAGFEPLGQHSNVCIC